MNINKIEINKRNYAKNGLYGRVKFGSLEPRGPLSQGLYTQSGSRFCYVLSLNNNP